jgi:hypothetical protein
MIESAPPNRSWIGAVAWFLAYARCNDEFSITAATRRRGVTRAGVPLLPLARHLLPCESMTNAKVQLTWLGSWKAYAVRLESGTVLGLIRCRVPFLPFRYDVEFLRG